MRPEKDYNKVNYTIEFNGKKIQIQEGIIDEYFLDDRIILVLKPNDDIDPSDRIISRNIICLGLDGKEMWRAEDHGRIAGFMEDGRHYASPYSQVGLGKDGNICAWDQEGYVNTLHPDTGKILASDPYWIYYEDEEE